MTSKWWLAVLFLALFTRTDAQTSARFVATAMPQKLALGETFDLTFTLTDGIARDFRPPTLSDFLLRSGPNQTISVGNNNGVQVQIITYRYVLQAKSVGNFSIAPASIQLRNGDILTSKTIRIEVSAAKKKTVTALNKNKKSFVRAALSRAEAYVGQQLILDYTLHTTAEVENTKLVQQPDYQGFFVQEIQNFEPQPQREKINGVVYKSDILRRLALFPQQTSELFIQPWRLELVVSAEKKDYTGQDIFFEPPSELVPVETNATRVVVKDLPQPQPSDFSGAVGSYSIESQLVAKEIRQGDAIEIRLFINGDGDSKRVQLPKITVQPTENVETYEPKIIRDESLDAGQKIRNTKEIAYLLLPQRAGKMALTPTFTYFDPDLKKYVTLRDSTYEVEVLPAAPRPSTLPGTDTEAPKSYLQNALGKSRKWILFSFLGSILLSLIIFKIIKNNKNVTKKINVTKNNEIQFTQLAQYYLKQNNSVAFYRAIFDGLQQFAAEKYGVSQADQTTQTTRIRSGSVSIPLSKIEGYETLLRICEEVLFGGQSKAHDMENTLQMTINWLKEDEII